MNIQVLLKFTNEHSILSFFIVYALLECLIKVIKLLLKSFLILCGKDISDFR